MGHGPLGTLVGRIRRLVAGPPEATATDRALIERFGETRDQEAFTALVGRHGPMVLEVCRRVLRDPHAADDAFQATFLLLADKARSVRWQQSIAGWLQQSAYRIASKARVAAARRRAHESQVPAMTNQEPPPLDPAFRAALDEELSRLPESYRLPLVLCYLEGKSTDEAAAQLCWPRGTVAGRLARARERLRDRLVRRGLGLSAAALAALLQAAAAQAQPAAALVASTVRSALIWVQEDAALAGSVAEPVAALVREVAQEMFTAKLKLVAAALVGIAITGVGAVWVGHQAFAADGPAAAAQNGARNADPNDPAKNPGDAKPMVRKLNVLRSSDALPPGGTTAKIYDSAKSLEPLGALGKELPKQVDFTKEKIVRVTYTTTGPPFGTLTHEVKEEGGKQVIVFFVQEPKVNARGQAAKLGDEFFAVPANVQVRMLGGDK